MHLYLHFGLTPRLHLGRWLVLETDLHRRAFVRIFGVGQWWFERGLTSFEPWRAVRNEVVPVPFLP